MTKNSLDKSKKVARPGLVRKSAVGCVHANLAHSIFDDWRPIQATMYWYRFGRLTDLKRRLPDQIPLGFGWIFNADKYYLEDIRLPPEQNRNHHYPVKQVRKRIEFWKRYLDPAVLGSVSLLTPGVTGVLAMVRRLFAKVLPPLPDTQKEYPESLKHNDHLLVYRSPTTGLIEWANLGEIRRLFYDPVAPEKKPDV